MELSTYFQPTIHPEIKRPVLYPLQQQWLETGLEPVPPPHQRQTHHPLFHHPMLQNQMILDQIRTMQMLVVAIKEILVLNLSQNISQVNGVFQE